MDISRRLASNGEISGTVNAADVQEEGRGRIRGRLWRMDKYQSLAFTILLRYGQIENIPRALTLRTGLAVSLAIEDFVSSLRSAEVEYQHSQNVQINENDSFNVLVKWPNDIMINSKKAGGILCEADGGNVHIGIGINVSQNDFPAHLSEKAVSISLASGLKIKKHDHFILLEKILIRLHDELACNKTGNAKEDWKARLEKRLYKKGEKVVFLEGAADSSKEVKGRLSGITDEGELLIIPEGETKPYAFITGEFAFRLTEVP
jgi:BirA family biotin operon repressor/biotin-[acetyl-CoA-carboxylase] ligase